MKRRRIEISRELLAILMNHRIFTMPVLTVMGLFHTEKPYLWLWAVAALIPMFFYLVREKVSNFFAFFALHFAVLAAVLISPLEVLPKVLLVVITIGYMVWSAKIRIFQEIKTVEQLHPVFVGAVIAVAFLIFRRFSELDWSRYYMAAMILYVLEYFIRAFLLDYERFLIYNKTSASNLPERAIFFSGFKQTLFYTAACTGVLLLAANFRLLAVIGQWLKKLVIAILRAFFSLFPTGPVVGEMVERPTAPPASDEHVQDLYPPGETSWLWEILEQILLIGLVVAMIALVIWGLVKGFRYLWKHFHEERITEYREGEHLLDVRESCAIETVKGSVGKLFVFRDNREKVRRIYRNKILRGKETLIGTAPQKELEYLTAAECCDVLREPSLRQVYEKVRYTEEEISSEDVKRAKSASKML